MAVEHEWKRLVGSLSEWASAREAPYGIEVTFKHSNGDSRTVEVVVSPDDWGGYWGCLWGDEDSAAAYIRHLLMTEMPVDKAFLVYGKEQWKASDTRDFPSDRWEDFQPEPGGHWVVTDREENAVSRYID